MNLIKRCTVNLSLALLIPAALMAQNTGSLRGQVTDPSGAAIPNASVTLTGPNNAVKVGQTDSSGNYSVAGLAPGQYTVRVMAPGFTLFEKNGLDLASGRVSNLDVPLSVQVEKQEVTVADTQQISIDPDKNAGALVLKGEDLDFLPDDPDDLAADLAALAGRPRGRTAARSSSTASPTASFLPRTRSAKSASIQTRSPLSSIRPVMAASRSSPRRARISSTAWCR